MALEARQFLRSQANKRYGSFLQELKRRGVTVTTSEAAELYHRVEPLVFGSAHAQVASAYGGTSPPVPPPTSGNVSRGRGNRSELTREVVEGAEDPETGASLSELKTSFLSAMDPDVETLDEYEVRLSQGVEMARADCRDEALVTPKACWVRLSMGPPMRASKSSPPMRRPKPREQTLCFEALAPVFQDSCRSQERILWRSTIVTMELSALTGNLGVPTRLAVHKHVAILA